MKDARALLRSHKSRINRGDSFTMQPRIRAGLETLRRAHSFLRGVDHAASTGDLSICLEYMSMIMDRMEVNASEPKAGTRCESETTDFRRALGNALFPEHTRPLRRIGDTLFRRDCTSSMPLESCAPTHDSCGASAQFSIGQIGCVAELPRSDSVSSRSSDSYAPRSASLEAGEAGLPHVHLVAPASEV